MVASMLVASIGSGVSVLLGKGDGTFKSHVDYAVGYIPRSLAIAALAARTVVAAAGVPGEPIAASVTGV